MSTPSTPPPPPPAPAPKRSHKAAPGSNGPQRNRRAVAYRSKIIPQALHAPVLERLMAINPDTRRTFTCAEVASWLFEVHEIKVCATTVQKLRASTVKNHQRLVAEAIKEKFSEALGPMLARLIRTSKRLDERCRTERNVQKLATATNSLARSVRDLAMLAGVVSLQVDVTVSNDVTASRTALAAQLEKLAAENERQEPGGSGGEPH